MLDYLGQRLTLPTSELDPALEPVAAYLLAWRAREGSLLTAPTVRSLPQDYVASLDQKLADLIAKIDLPSEIIARHPGVSAASLQALLTYFRTRSKPVEELLPSSPESDDAYSAFTAIFHRINNHVYPAFLPKQAVPVHALVTLEWMRGFPLGKIIRNRIAYMERKNRPYKLAALIRDTMADVEEIARFKAPKYLAAYLDVLKHYLASVDQESLLPPDLRFDLYLEFGVATETLLSFIGLGLSRTSAVAINEFLGNDKMTEDQVLQWLSTRRWETQDLPAVVKREIDALLQRRTRSQQAA
jgi:hypothetical protein